MDLEEHTLESAGERCEECGAKLTPAELEQVIENGGPTLCAIHAAEVTRELLTRYFDVARTTVSRYGGMVEKFIGDAVMAVWGAPVAQEDDAERAVRAALELAAAVPELEGSLRVRAGVLTGEAAVT